MKHLKVYIMNACKSIFMHKKLWAEDFYICILSKYKFPTQKLNETTSGNGEYLSSGCGVHSLHCTYAWIGYFEKKVNPLNIGQFSSPQWVNRKKKINESESTFRHLLFVYLFILITLCNEKKIICIQDNGPSVVWLGTRSSKRKLWRVHWEVCVFICVGVI